MSAPVIFPGCFLRSQDRPSSHTWRKIEYAVNLIRNTNSSILDIALDSGFNSIRTFNRCFKTVTGCIPTTIRKDRES
ncbi:helix-turn-helix domain-containing protein [Lachnospiraceae bacterium ASD5720]|uniref:Helix-turn-helix domain-containing protein n=1 Tax=Diplocloster agilis TaxID=2850323 RepID=A0A949NG87_9FIRM|nr:helix-turn-helix domain-containing protein [Diplocloster agilis]